MSLVCRSDSSWYRRLTETQTIRENRERYVDWPNVDEDKLVNIIAGLSRLESSQQ